MAKSEENKKQLPINKEEFDNLVAQCLEIIESHKIFFISDLVAFLPFSRATFYNYGLDKLDTIKNAIEKNKITAKQLCRAKWFGSDNATLQIAFYKLIATPEERNILNNKTSTDEAEIAHINVMSSIKVNGESLNLNIGEDPNDGADTP